MTLVKGSLVDLMTAIQTLNQTAANAATATYSLPSSNQPHVYRLRPVSNIELPAIYPWIGPSPFQVMDLSRGRDTIAILNRVAVRYTIGDGPTAEEDMELLMQLHDAYVKSVDTALWGPRLDPSLSLLGLVAHAAQRTSVRMMEDVFNEVHVLAMEHTINVELDRAIR